MRALRILLIGIVILGGALVTVDRLAVHFAEGEVADRIKTSENLRATPDVSIDGFPFLTQLVGGSLEEVRIGIEEYEAGTGGERNIRIDDLRADMRGVEFSGDFGSATAADATGTASVTYDELLKAAGSGSADVGPGITASVVGLSDGGNGTIRVEVAATVLGTELPEPLTVLSSVTVVDGDTVRVQADALPSFGGIELAEARVREIIDFEQRIDSLPGGIELDKVVAGESGVDITVRGSDVRLAG